MTDDEMKFLEVIYNRGSLAEKSYLNYMHASLGAGSSDESVTQEVETIFSRLSDSGLITGLPQAGLYRITELGREKYESLSEKSVYGLQNSFYYASRRRRFHLSRRVWIALAVMATIFSITLSSIIGHWEDLVDAVKRLIS